MCHSSNLQFMSRARKDMCPYSYKQEWQTIVAAQIDPWKKILKSCRQGALTRPASTVPLQIEGPRSECQDTCFSAHLHEPKGARRNNDRQGSPDNLIRSNGAPELAPPQVIPREPQTIALEWGKHSLNHLPVRGGGRGRFYGKNISGSYKTYYREKDQK